MIDTDTLEPRFMLTYRGTVVDNQDPLGLSRVKVKVPGIFDDPSTGWASPKGSWGGGAKQRGTYGPPDVGAEVALGFYMADERDPYYEPAHWGEGEGSSYTAGMSAADAAKCHIVEFQHFLLAFDERSGNEQLIIRDKDHADSYIRIAGGVIELGGTGLNASINGVVLGSCVDPFTGATHAALAGGASTIVMAKK